VMKIRKDFANILFLKNRDNSVVSADESNTKPKNQSLIYIISSFKYPLAIVYKWKSLVILLLKRS
jgi:hypothetical protein